MKNLIENHCWDSRKPKEPVSVHPVIFLGTTYSNFLMPRGEVAVEKHWPGNQISFQQISTWPEKIHFSSSNLNFPIGNKIKGPDQEIFKMILSLCTHCFCDFIKTLQGISEWSWHWPLWKVNYRRGKILPWSHHSWDSTIPQMPAYLPLCKEDGYRARKKYLAKRMGPQEVVSFGRHDFFS